MRQTYWQDRFISIMSASFAGVATLLAAIGLYGVLAYTVVAAHPRIRPADGARRRNPGGCARSCLDRSHG